MIRTESLTKRYGSVTAVNKLDLTVEAGTVFGFIGPNGAGKSTTMQILATLVVPDEGRAWVGGWDVVKDGDEVRRIIGYMPDFFGVYDNLTAIEYLEFYASCYGIRRDLRRKIGLDLLELVGLSHKRDDEVDKLSRGMKQRLGLARSLIHDPALLILDEPASGLDPRARVEFREVLKELRKMGKTIMISSHILPELAGFCDCIGMMENGKMVAFGNVDEMTRRTQTGRIIEIRVREKAEEAEELLGRMKPVQSVHREDRLLTVLVDGDEAVQEEILRELLHSNIPVTGFTETKEDIEDVFLRVTGEKEGSEADETAD
ncbi:ABC transporter ATP-binding protein [Staphylospora marina]|uniref:ABC transporter ATP-binding protein n=1 Tax=Staphylospora marina TaxID=2490858 RepID=UPI000F5BE314|nr:ABC transporter ATP-binding protein [Staphylospora marina]